MRISVIIAVFVALPALIQAAGPPVEQFDKEEMRLFKQANFYFDLTDYRTALDMYDSLYDAHPKHPELNYRIGVSIFSNFL